MIRKIEEFIEIEEELLNNSESSQERSEIEIRIKALYEDLNSFKIKKDEFEREINKKAKIVCKESIIIMKEGYIF